MKAAVTGATGFIGGKLVKKLLEEGYEVKCLVRNTKKAEALEKHGAEIYHGDLADLDSLKDFPKDCDYLFHIAALVSDWGSREDFFKINVEATRTLLNSSKEHEIKKFIHMSSSTVVWKSDFWNIHDLKDINEVYPYPEEFNDFYNESKAESEKLVLKFYRETGLQTVVIRPSNVWGAGDIVILPRIAMAAKKNILIPMGKGERIVTPCHVDNLVHGIILAAQSKNSPGKIYFINDGLKSEYMKFLGDQLEAIGLDWAPKFSIPYKLGYFLASMMELIFKLVNSKKPPVLTKFAVAALSGSRSYSILRARKDLDYSPIVSYDEGIERLGEWIKNIGGLEALIGD